MSDPQNTNPSEVERERAIHEAEARVDALNKASSDRGGDAASGRASPAEAPPAAVRSKAPVLGLLLTLGLITIAWWGTFFHIWDRWFPHWKHTRMDLMDRLTAGDSYYTHGPLVIITGLIICFFIYRRIGAPVARTTSSNAAGWVLLIMSLMLHLVSVVAGVAFASGFSLIGVLLALMLLWGGWPLMRAYWLPAAILIFAVPLPEVAIDDLNFRLKIVAANTSVWVTNNVFGIPVNLDGSEVQLLPNADGTPKTLMVEDVCSGLRSLISLTFFAALFAMVCRVKGAWRIVMLVLAVPVAIAANVVRITSLTLVSHWFGTKAADQDSAFHGASGLLVFAVALAILFAMEWAIIKLAGIFKRDWTDERLLGYLDRIPPVRRASLGLWRPGLVGVMIAATVLSVLLAREPAPSDRTALAKSLLPMSLTMADGRVFAAHGPDLEMTKLEMEILENPSYLYRRFRHQGTGRAFEVLVVFSANNRKAVHPPEICLKGGGFNVVEREVVPVAMPDREAVPMQQLLAQWNNQATYFLYVYKSGEHYTPSFFMQQATVFYNGFVGRLYGSDPAGALIRITVSAPQNGQAEAHDLLLTVAQQVMPQIDKGLSDVSTGDGKAVTGLEQGGVEHMSQDHKDPEHIGLEPQVAMPRGGQP